MKLTYRCSNLLIVALLLGVLCAAMPRGGDSLLSRAQAQDGAQDWPLKPIHAIVPFTAGSATDIVARTVFEPLSHELGQSIIVDGGTSPREVASTIIDLTDEEARWRIMREGAIPAQEISEFFAQG